MTLAEAQAVVDEIAAKTGGMRVTVSVADKVLGGFPVSFTPPSAAQRRLERRGRISERNLTIRKDALDRLTPGSLGYIAALLVLSSMLLSSSAKRMDFLASFFALPIVGFFFWNYVGPAPWKIAGGIACFGLFIGAWVLNTRALMRESRQNPKRALAVTRDLEGAREYLRMEHETRTIGVPLQPRLDELEKAAAELGLS